MSREVEQRIVEMRFDNKDFEKNAQATMKTLDEFESKLNMKGAARGIEELSNAGKQFSLHPMESAAEAVEVKFSAMSVAAMAAIQRIVDKSMDAGERLIKSLSVDQVTAGWDKYAEKTSAVQTIMAATAKQYDNAEAQMADVNKQLEKLNWFTDETSYSFLDMVNNIGKFTSQNIGLEESVTAMQGISTWAAISGANVQEAGRAMYNLSQAMGTGSVKLIDWKSIENANMATAEFKENVLETAAALGYLKDLGDGVYSTLDGKATVSVQDFNSALSKGWFDKEVLMTVLEDYGAFSDKLYEVQNATGLTATELLKAVDMYKAGSKDLGDVFEDIDMPAEDFMELIKEMSSDVYDLGWRSFKAAQEAKTFGEAISSVKDAVSTGWMNTFEIIFGDYEQARKLWTVVANELYEIFAESGNLRNEMLKDWSKAGGRDIFLEGVSNAWSNFKDILYAIKEALHDIFPPMTADRLLDITKKFRDLTTQFKLTPEALTGLTKVVKALLSPLKLVGKVAKTAGKWLGKLTSRVFKLTTSFLELVAEGDPIPKLLKKIFSGEKYEKGAKLLKSIGEGISKAFSDVRDKFDQLFPKSERFQGIIKTVSKYLGDFKDILVGGVLYGLEELSKIDISQIFTDALQSVKDLFDYFSTHSFGDVVGDAVTAIGNGLKSGLPKAISDAFTTVFGWLSTAWDKVSEFFGGEDDDRPFFERVVSGIKTAIEGIQPAIESFKQSLKGLIGQITPAQVIIGAFGLALTWAILSFTNLLTTLKDTSTAVKGFFSTLTKKIVPKNTVLKDLATAIGVLTLALVVLSQVDGAGLRNAETALWTIADVIAALSAGVAIGGAALSDAAVKRFKAIMDSIKDMSLAMVGMAAALKILSTVDMDGIWKKLGALALAMGEFVIAAVLISALTKGNGLNKFPTASLVALALSMLVVVEALNRVQEIDAITLSKSIKAFGIAVGELALLSWAAKGIKVGSAIAVIIMAESLTLVAKSLKKLAKMPVDDVLAALPVYREVFKALLGLAVVARIAGAHASGFGIGLLALAAGSKLMINVIKALGEIPESEARRGLTIAGVLMAIFGVISAIAGAFGGMNWKSGVGMIGLAVAINLLVPAVKALGSLDVGQVLLGGLAVSALLVVAGYVVKLAALGPGMKSATASIMAMVAVIGMLTFAIGILSMLPDKEKVSVAGQAIVACMLALGVAAKAAQGVNFKNMLPAAIMMGLLLGEVIGTLAILDGFSSEGMLEKAESVAVVLGAFTAVFAVLGVAAKYNIDPKQVAKMGLAFDAVGLLITSLVGVLGGISMIPGVQAAFDTGIATMKKFSDPEFLKTLAEFGAIFAAVGGLTYLANKANVNKTDVIKMAATFDAVVGILTALVLGIGGLLEILNSVGGDSVLDTGLSAMKKMTGSDMLGTWAELLTGFAIFAGGSKFNIDSAGAIKLAATFDAVVVVIVAMITALGAIFAALEEYGGDKWLDKGITVISKLGGLIGSFIGELIGGIVGGFGEGVSDHAPTIGANLSTFMRNISGFLEGARNIGEDTVTGVENFKKVLETLNKCKTNVKGLDKLGEELATYAGSLNGVDFDLIFNSTKPVGALVELQNSIESAGGLAGLITGNQSLGQFGFTMKNLASGIKYYAEGLDGVNLSVLTNSVEPVKAFVRLQNSIKDAGGIFGWFTGSQSLADFSANMKILGEGMAYYVKAIEGVELGRIGDSVTPVQSFVEIQNSLENTGWLTGKKSLKDFSADLKILGDALKYYSDKMSDVGWDNIDTSISYLRKIMEAAGELAGFNPATAASATQTAGTVGRGVFDAFTTGSLGGQGEAEKTGQTLIGKVLGGISKLFPSVSDSGTKTGETWTQAIEALGTARELTGSGAVSDYVTGVTNALPLTTEAGKEVDKSFLLGFLSSPNERLKAARTYIQPIADTMKTEGYTSMFGAAKRVAQGLLDGLRGMGGAISSAGAGMAATLNKAFRNQEQIKSPSRVFRGYGQYIVQGLTMGIEENLKSVKESASVLGDSVSREVFGIISNIANMDTDMEINPVIRPVLDMANVRDGSIYADHILAGWGTMDFVNQANLAMQYPDNFNQNATMIEAVDRLDSQISGIEVAVENLRNAVDVGLSGTIAGAVKESLNGIGVSMDRRAVGQLITNYQDGVSRRGGR